MEAMIRRVICKGFRSIPKGVVDFSNPTFLVGKNGSGKSNFADAFAFLGEAMASPLQAVFDRRGGISVVRNRPAGQSRPPNLGLGVIFNSLNGLMHSGRYAFEVKAIENHGFEVVREQCVVVTADGGRYWFDRHNGQFKSSFDGFVPSLEPTLLVLPVVAGEARFAPAMKALSSMRVYKIEPAKLRDMQDPDGGITLRSDGSNAASVLQEIERHPSEHERIEEILASIVPNTRNVQTVKHGNKLALKFTQEWGGKRKLSFESYSMSDGTLRVLGLLLAVFQKPKPSLILLEEPESTIHPGALGAVLDLIRHAGKFMQVIVTTHSPELLDAEWIEDENIRIATWSSGQTHISPLSASSRQALRTHLMGAGELLRSNALDADWTLFDDKVEQAHLFEDLI